MATLYLARDIQHERPVALKVLHPELAVSLGAERFQREIRMAARLQHPHILGVHDSGSVGEYLWFTMPFVEGEGLRERLTREGQLSVSEAVRITREAALALDFAHRTLCALPGNDVDASAGIVAEDSQAHRGRLRRRQRHWGLKIGHTYRLMGDSARARAFGDSALVAFDAQLRDFPERAQLRELRGRALALGGHRQEAIAEAERSLKLRETSLDASIRPYVHFQVARILIQSGEYERALDLIEPLLTAPASDLTPAHLRIDPTFRPLYGNPRFERLAGKTAPP